MVDAITKIGIIGTAGRGTDKIGLDKAKWEAMRETVTGILVADIAYSSSIVLDGLVYVSGGAAYADHIAVSLFYRGAGRKLILHLPCNFDFDNCCFEHSKTGDTANYYHEAFSETVTGDQSKSLRQLKAVLNMKNCEHTISNGFFERNSLVANDSDYLIALTFGHKEYLKDGGTADTMKKFIKKKSNKNTFHVDLHTMEVYRGAKV